MLSSELFEVVAILCRPNKGVNEGHKHCTGQIPRIFKRIERGVITWGILRSALLRSPRSSCWYRTNCGCTVGRDLFWSRGSAVATTIDVFSANHIYKIVTEM